MKRRWLFVLRSEVSPLRRVAMVMTVGLALAVCLPAQAIVLTYAPRVGEVHKHKETVSGRTESTMEGADQPMRGEITGEREYSEKALSQTDRVTRVQTDLRGGKITLVVLGQSQSMDMPTGKLIADVDSRGQMLNSQFSGSSGTLGSMLPGGDTPGLSQYGTFAAGDVDLNDEWTGKVTIPASQGMPATELTFKSTLLDLTTFQDRKCAKIRTTFTGPLKADLSDMPSMPAGIETTTEGAMSGDLVLYYDYENSVYVYGEGTISMDMKTSMSGAGMPAASMTTKLLMNIKTSLQP